MGRLIDADELIRWLKLTCSSPCNCDSCGERGSKTCVQCVAEWAIDNAPTVDPVKHGKWINGDCSECGFSIPTDDKIDYIAEADVHYCYNCGAKMDGE